MIKAGKIKIEWFGSIEKLTYNFGRPGLNTIQGLNGAGKSTIFNALSWVIYKQLLKKNCTIEPWPHLLNERYKGTRVRFEFTDKDHHYQIIRCIDYKGKVLDRKGKNRLVFLIDGQEIKAKGKKGIQPEIIKAWGYSFDLFKSAVVFGQRIKRFVEEDGPNKKRIFDEAFEATFISKAKELVQKRLDKTQKEYESISNRTKATRLIYTSLKSHYKDIKELSRIFKETQAQKIATLTKKSRRSKKPN
jgi:exonuclease SbcC